MTMQKITSAITLLSLFLIALALAEDYRNWIKIHNDLVNPEYVNTQSDNFEKGFLQPVNVIISQIDVSKFPIIEVYVDVVDENGVPILGLTESDFCVSQDGEPVRFQVGRKGTTRALSVGLVMDVSGSMGTQNKLEDVKKAANRFVDHMDIFDRVAIITYESCVDTAQGFTSNRTDLRNAINNLIADGGTAMYDGFWLGVNQTCLEIGNKAVIGFTDGLENNSDVCWPPPDGDWPPGSDPEGLQDDCDSVVTYANSCGFPIYTIGLGRGADEDGLRCLAERTGGYYRYAPSGEAVDSLYEEIKNGLVSRYFIVYVSPDTVADDGIHEVIVCEGGMSCIPCDTTTYFEPCLPVIFQTPETEALSDTCQSAGEDLIIEVEVTDPCPLDVFRVSLSYRVAGSGSSYTEVSMVKISGDLYRGTIPDTLTPPGTPGVDYYIVAANGVVSVSDPPNNAQEYPKQISICPNERPVMVHTPEDCPWPGSPDTVEVEVTDPTDYVDRVRLFFREKGDILYDEVEMINVAGSTYRGVIPGSYIGSAGVEYYIVGADNYDLKAYDGTDISPHHIVYCGPCLVTLNLPSDVNFIPCFSVQVPIRVSSQEEIGLAQFVVEYRSAVVSFDSAILGPDAPGFAVTNVNPNLPFPATHSQTDENVLVQISGGGSDCFSGSDQEVIILVFDVQAQCLDPEVPDTSFLFFDEGIDRTFLTTCDPVNITNGAICFENGIGECGCAGICGHVRVCDSQCPVSGVHVAAETTDTDGYYQFGACTFPVTLTPTKTGDVVEAITGSDALMVLQHLAYQIRLTMCQYKRADVNLDGRITGADAMCLIQYLAKTPCFSIAEWVFDPDSVTIATPGDYCCTNPQDFTAYLLGDVNGSWCPTPAAKVTVAEVGSNAELVVRDTEVAVGDEVEVPVILKAGQESVHTLVFSLEYDPSVLEYRSTVLTDETAHFLMVANGEEAGQVHVAMAGVEGVKGVVPVVNVRLKVKEADLVELGVVSDVRLTRALVNDVAVNGLAGQVKVVDVVAKGGDDSVPEKFELSQNYPNPFNPTTTIRFAIPSKEQRGQSRERRAESREYALHSTLKIYNLQGQVVRTLVDELRGPGYYTVSWDGRNGKGEAVSSGMYFYALTAGTYQSTRKMVLLR